MMAAKVQIARIVAGGTTLIVGGVFQVLLWKTAMTGYLKALESHPYLWLLYLLFGLFMGEQTLKWLKRE